jgi:hypothetical protein
MIKGTTPLCKLNCRNLKKEECISLLRSELKVMHILGFSIRKSKKTEVKLIAMVRSMRLYWVAIKTPGQ